MCAKRLETLVILDTSHGVMQYHQSPGQVGMI